jgi:hypothetical protein
MFLAFAFCLSAPSAVSAGTDVKFTWDYFDPPPGDFWFVLQEKTPTDWIDVIGADRIDKNLREFVLPDVADGVYTWRLLAEDEGERSLPSNEVIKEIDTPLPRPENFKVVTQVTVTIRDGRVVAHNYKSEVFQID